MRKGQLVLMLLAVMVVMTLVTQNLKSITPLVRQFAQVQRQNPPAPADQKLLQQLGAQDLQAPTYKHLQKIFSQLAQAVPDTPLIAKHTQPAPPSEASLFKDWMDSAIQQAKHSAKPAPTQAPPTKPQPPAEADSNAKPFIQITEDFPPQITNPHFTARQLRAARIRLREMRLNYQETALDVRQQFGPQAEEKLKQAAAQAEQKAASAAQNAKDWKSFEKTLTQINTQYEGQLKKIILKYVR